MYSELGEWKVDGFVNSILPHHQVLRILCLLSCSYFTYFYDKQVKICINSFKDRV